MKNLKFDGICNHAVTLANMMREELKQEAKHAANPRCKPAEWGGIATYVEYAYGIEKPSKDKVYEMAHTWNWG